MTDLRQTARDHWNELQPLASLVEAAASTLVEIATYRDAAAHNMTRGEFDSAREMVRSAELAEQKFRGFEWGFRALLDTLKASGFYATRSDRAELQLDRIYLFDLDLSELPKSYPLTRAQRNDISTLPRQLKVRVLSAFFHEADVVETLSAIANEPAKPGRRVIR